MDSIGSRWVQMAGLLRGKRIIGFQNSRKFSGELNQLLRTNPASRDRALKEN
jgi:hypothetical protein